MTAMSRASYCCGAGDVHHAVAPWGRRYVTARQNTGSPSAVAPGPQETEQVGGRALQEAESAACGDHRGIVENIYAYVILRIGALHKFYDSSAKRDAGC